MTKRGRVADLAGKEEVEAPSPNRPPRTKRPPEVARHVNETIDAYRRVVKTRKPSSSRRQKD